MNKTVHIVCLDAPSPADYGGVFDLFYKIPALHKLGIKIILHYFDYKEGRNADGLEKYCEAIHSYKRASFSRSLLSRLPYIVHSRINDALINRLKSDSHPVILEGIHCSGIIPYLDKDRKIILRLHNDEAAYYEHLARWERNILRKIYLQREAKLLEKYQSELSNTVTLACVSETDMINFKSRYGFTNTHFIPCFIPWQKVISREGMGDYCLYHGNLEVSENTEAARWLIENVFDEKDYFLIIAGKGASSLSTQYADSNVRFVESPDDKQLNELIADAHIHVLPAFNKTGVKLKLLHALFQGRFCYSNRDGVSGSGLEQYVSSPEGAFAWKTAVKADMMIPFNNESIHHRQQMLSLYNNESSARKLSELL